MYITNSDIKKAKIHWVLKYVANGFGNNSCLKLNNLFCEIFPDCRIAQPFKLGAGKIRYTVNFGIATYLRSLINLFVACFDFKLKHMKWNL